VLKPIKSLGQNFLRDENVLRKIADGLDLKADDLVIEIGPGQGALTKHLCEKKVRLIGIEIDERAVRLLHERFAGNLEIVHGDVLKTDIHDIAKNHDGNVRIVGNIPYYLTSEILFWLFDAHATVSDATLMMQLEVARRLAAPPKNKEYGILSVFTQFYTDCELLFKVSRNCFYPVPEVDSAIVHMRFKKTLPKCNEQMFRTVVRSTFGHRRKTLRNGLKSMGFDDEILNKIHFDLKKRPEELGVDEFLNLCESIEKNKK
jgi:16S rRNA (adenine1518-N6/adenine1519-N6)-dimethyltransferase